MKLLNRTVVVVVLALYEAALGQSPASAPAAFGPRAALMQFAAAVQAGDAAAVKDRLHAKTTAEMAIADVMAQTVASAADLRKAAEEKFGAAAAKKLGGATPLNADLKRLEQAQEKVEGDAATVEIPAGGKSVIIRLIRVDGQWKIPVVDLLGGEDPENLSRLLPTMRSLARAMQTTAGDVSADRYKNADEAAEALRTRMRETASTMPVDVPKSPATRP